MMAGGGVTKLRGTVVRGKLITVNTDAFDFDSKSQFGKMKSSTDTVFLLYVCQKKRYINLKFGMPNVQA